MTVDLPRPRPERRPSGPSSRGRGFTLLEMMLVMLLLGIVAGLGFAGLDRVDPGHRGLQVTLVQFLAQSRERARTSGHPVRVDLAAETAERGARLERRVFAAAMEATFEPGFREREGVETHGDAALGGVGRFGAGLAVGPGGGAVVLGRGGGPRTRDGVAVELEFLNPDGARGDLLAWEGLLEVSWVRSGMRVRVRSGGDQGMAWVEAPIGVQDLRFGRWQHLEVVAADGRLSVALDGATVAEAEIGPWLGEPTAPLRLGGSDDSTHSFLADELVVATRRVERGPELPELVRLDFPADGLVFDADGLLDRVRHPEPVELRLHEGDDLLLAFRVGRFTEEALP